MLKMIYMQQSIGTCICTREQTEQMIGWLRLRLALISMADPWCIGMTHDYIGFAPIIVREGCITRNIW